MKITSPSLTVHSLRINFEMAFLFQVIFYEHTVVDSSTFKYHQVVCKQSKICTQFFKLELILNNMGGYS